MSSKEEPGFEDLWEVHLIFTAEVSGVVGKAPEVDEIVLEMLRTLDIVGLPWFTCLFSFAWMSGTVPLDW